MTAEKVELGRYPVLRHAALGQRHAGVRELPRSGARVHRRQRDAARRDRRARHSQRDEPRERRLQQLEHVGSRRAAPRGSGAPADVRHVAGRDGARRRRGRGTRAARGRPDRTRAVRGGVSRRRRRSRSTTSRARSRASSGRSSRATRRFDRFVAGERLRSSDASSAGSRCSSPSGSAARTVTAASTSRPSYDHVGMPAGAPGRSSSTPASTMSTAGAYPAERSRARRGHAASRATWAGFARRRFGTSR